ncbi:histidine kinase [Microbulbifer sp. YPW1]|uniref:histidine kinase n=1 Tax=unclassified Microbulbifer TaxID=2619833 RepID=UPI00159B5BBE|nr:histidine kinase [Microbulbifer sp. YPW1]QKX15906.1 type IV pili methyl-accepting chemotaxis transducer N-terminal domain-containing protein [Microbulbifer sp. YPW1]
MGRVFHRIRQSIVFRIGVLLLLTAFVAISSMVASYVISDAAQHDAEAINVSGFVRAMSYKLASTAQSGDAAATRELADALNKRLNKISTISNFRDSDSSQVARDFHEVKSDWQQEMRPLLEAVASGEHEIDSKELLAAAETFVNKVDRLVLDYQRIAEEKVEFLRIVQLGSLFATITLVYFSMFTLSRSVEQPLRQLIASCREIARGNFRPQLAPLDSEDELGMLTQTIKGMSEVIDQTHRELEDRVEEKTRQLQQSHKVLDFQYRLARRISEGPLNGQEIERWLEEFSALTGLPDLDLCLMTQEGETPYEHLIYGEGNRSCEEQECFSCSHSCGPTEGIEQRLYRYPLEADKRNYGVLVCSLPANQLLHREQQQRLSAFADAITTAITLKERGEHERRVALMGERGIIARELHDSLAQSLSYLKIQVARLSRCTKSEEIDREQVIDITDELKQGLNSSYRQLRELLTTFRLQVSEGGLRDILRRSVEQYREQHPEIDIEFNYELDEIPLTPNEEIHLLQLVREASQNAVYHSWGDHVSISLVPGPGQQVFASICDNGKGISDSPEKRNHFGMSIMQERASNLGGALDIHRRDAGGTEVAFSFLPEYARARQMESGNAGEVFHSDRRAK